MHKNEFYLIRYVSGSVLWYPECGKSFKIMLSINHLVKGVCIAPLGRRNFYLLITEHTPLGLIYTVNVVGDPWDAIGYFKKFTPYIILGVETSSGTIGVPKLKFHDHDTFYHPLTVVKLQRNT